jgi:hypothetical protein
MQALMAIRQFDRPDQLSVPTHRAKLTLARQCLGCCRLIV